MDTPEYSRSRLSLLSICSYRRTCCERRSRAFCLWQSIRKISKQGAKIVVCGSQTSYSEGLDLSPGWDLWAIGDIDDVCARHPSTELFLFNGFESREQGPFFPIS